MLDGEVTANRAAQMEAHAARCPDCEREITQLAQLIGEIEQPVAQVDRSDVAAIMRKLDDAPEAAPPSRRVWLYSAAAVASAAAVLLVMSFAGGGDDGQRDPGTFTARGGPAAGSELERSVGFSFYAGAGAEAELSDGASIAADTPLTATYRNITSEPAQALIFAVDAGGDVHWLYPAYTDPSSDPAAVTLAAEQRDGRFGQTVVMDDPTPGTMMLVTVVSRSAMKVSDVEGSSEPGVDALRRRFPDAVVTALAVEVAR